MVICCEKLTNIGKTLSIMEGNTEGRLLVITRRDFTSDFHKDGRSYSPILIVM